MPVAQEEWTVRRVLEWTTAHLRENGSESPRLDAEILLAFSRKCERILLYTDFDQPMSDAERSTMRELVKRRAAAEPVAYLVGQREFFGLSFTVNSSVLVPRPETETLVVEAIEIAKPLDTPRILDVGTGSGCIAVSLAVNLPRAELVAVDVSGPALQTCRENAIAHGVSDRVNLIESDLLSAMEGKFDLIVSNPPYIADHEFDTLQPDVRLFEPRMALTAGPEGLDCLRRLIAEAPSHLVACGWLLVEIDPAQAEAVCEMFRASGFDEITVHRDAARENRVVAGRLAG